jgi:hypothetical protein
LYLGKNQVWKDILLQLSIIIKPKNRQYSEQKTNLCLKNNLFHFICNNIKIQTLKNTTLLAATFVSLIFACGTDKNEISKEVNSFKAYTDSILAANTEYLAGVDTLFMERPKSPTEPDVIVIDTMIQKHSNLMDTTNHWNNNSLQILTKYNSMEQHLDSAKSKMDTKTLELYESIKQKMNAIKQPIE